MGKIGDKLRKFKWFLSKNADGWFPFFPIVQTHNHDRFSVLILCISLRTLSDNENQIESKIYKQSFEILSLCQEWITLKALQNDGGIESSVFFYLMKM